MNGNIIFKTDSIQTITRILIELFQNSKEIMSIIEADKYYNKKSRILNKTRNYRDKDGNEHENPSASNAKLSTAFLRQLVQQKQDYGFAKTFILKVTKNGEEVQKTTEKDDDLYLSYWKDFIENKLFKLAYSASKNAVNEGIAWVFIWIDENQELNLKLVPSALIYPLWKDNEHMDLDRLVYHYTTLEYETSNIPKRKEYGEYWDNQKHIIYDISDGYSEVPQLFDKENKPIYSHMVSDGKEISWDKIPFIAFKGTEDETPLLFLIKEQLDALEELISKGVDGIIDDLDPIMLIKGVNPSLNDILETRELLKMTRTASVDSDGDVKYVQAQTSVESNLTMVEKLRQDIIRFGYGVDYQDARFNGNPNQMVIKSLYQNLDTYTDGLERNFQSFIDNLKYFFDKWLEWKGLGTAEKFKEYKVLIKLDRDMMINQSSMIEDAVKLANTGISLETQLEFNPVVQDVELEKQRLEEERKEAEKNNPLFNFDDSLEDESNTNKEEE